MLIFLHALVLSDGCFGENGIPTTPQLFVSSEELGWISRTAQSCSFAWADGSVQGISMTPARARRRPFFAAFNYQIAKDTDLAVNVSNLLDEQHVVGSGTADYYNPGRELTAKLSYSW